MDDGMQKKIKRLSCRMVPINALNEVSGMLVMEEEV